MDSELWVVIALQCLSLIIKIFEHITRSRCHTCCGLCETESDRQIRRQSSYQQLARDYESFLSTSSPRPAPEKAPGCLISATFPVDSNSKVEQIV